jgi:spermidine synthase
MAVMFFFGTPLLCYALATRLLQFVVALARSVGRSIFSRSPLGRGEGHAGREPLRNFLFVRRPLLFAAGMGLFMFYCSSLHEVSRNEAVLEQTRNFYGVLRVSSALEAGKPQLRLTNGTTSHGVQWYHREPQTMTPFFAPLAACLPQDAALDTVRRYLLWTETDREPLSYYPPTGPIGQVFAEFSGAKAKANVAVIGLGTGTLASYGQPGQTFLFFDIDPAVVRVAGVHFSYLKNCRAKWDVVLGDARLRIQSTDPRQLDFPSIAASSAGLLASPWGQGPLIATMGLFPGQFQLIIVDAFNSDSIPIHLLTREALELYFEKLSLDGILALHISNRYLDLEPVLGNLAKELHLVGLSQYDTMQQDIPRIPGKRSAHWVLLARHEEDFGKMATDRRWRPIRSRPDVGVWTDDYSNLLGVFKWN